MKRLSRFIGTASLVTLGLTAVPLSASADSPRTAEPSQKPSPESTADPAYGGEALIDKALEEVHLRPEQKSAVDALKAEAEKRHAPVKAAKHELGKVIADQLETGKLDRCALEPAIDSLASAKAEARPGDRGAFEKLHSILDPEQRATFVDALKREWESVKKMHEPAALAEKMAKELNLDPDQQTSLEKIFTGLHEVREAEPWYAARRERWAKILDAFQGEDFHLDQIAPMGDVKAHTKAKVEGMLWEGEAILPVLNPEQRKAAADKMREKLEKAGPATRSISPGMGPSEGE